MSGREHWTRINYSIKIIKNGDLDRPPFFDIDNLFNLNHIKAGTVS